ncbi:MAG TPA: S41 family peptidase [Puia sp.]|jgi:carboxyl-terminal processing protease|nr:S41 family peptidase [Puia sp.]
MIRSLSHISLLAAVLVSTNLFAADTLPSPCMEKAEKLLDEVLGFMQKNYYRKQEVSWPDLETKAKQQLHNAGTCEDAYASISWCFRQLNEPHSFVMPPDKAARYTGEDEVPDEQSSLARLVGEIRGEWLQDSIGYLTVPWVSTTDSLICERVADSLQSIIARLDSRGISRWIIDLRKNSGGNCWPMLTGLGPLLGDGVFGYFVAPGARIPIAYHDGSAFQGRHVLCRVSSKGYHTQHDHHSIVVLTGRRTVSAGEIVALAFRGREQTCLIGEPTAGLTTANATYSLSDRSMLVLTVCQEADRTGRICEGSIQPDKIVASAGPGLPSADPAREAALAWLNNR